MRRSVLLATLAFLLPACLPDEVSLSYGTRPGRQLAYDLRLEATIHRTLASQTRRQTIVAAFHAEQQILSRLPGGEAAARMTLRPRSLTVDGRAQQVGPPQSFEVTLGDDGRILDIQRSDERDEAVPEGPTSPEEEPLAPLGIDRLIPRLRPVLPGRPVSPGERWRSVSEFQDEGGRFSLELDSRLAALGVRDGHRAALVRTTYSSPVRRREVFSNAVTDIHGEDRGTQEAWFALDGFLIEASGDSVGTYRLLFRPPGGTGAGLDPVEGALRVHLRTEMRLVGR